MRGKLIINLLRTFRRTWEQPWSVIIERIASELGRAALAHG